MHDKERSDFYFSSKKKQKKHKQPFSAFTNIQLQCLNAWSKKTHLVIAYIKRLFVRDTGTPSIANKHLIALECFSDKCCQPWPYRNTVPIHCYCMKEELWCKLFWYVRWFKLGYLWVVSSSTFCIHVINKQIMYMISASRNAGTSSMWGDIPLILTQ